MSFVLYIILYIYICISSFSLGDLYVYLSIVTSASAWQFPTGLAGATSEAITIGSWKRQTEFEGLKTAASMLTLHHRLVSSKQYVGVPDFTKIASSSNL